MAGQVGSTGAKAMRSYSRAVKQNQQRRSKQTQQAQKHVKTKLARNRQAIQSKAKQNQQVVSSRVKALTEQQSVPTFMAAAAAGIIDVSV